MGKIHWVRGLRSMYHKSILECKIFSIYWHQSRLALRRKKDRDIKQLSRKLGAQRREQSRNHCGLEGAQGKEGGQQNLGQLWANKYLQTCVLCLCLCPPPPFNFFLIYFFFCLNLSPTTERKERRPLDSGKSSSFILVFAWRVWLSPVQWIGRSCSVWHSSGKKVKIEGVL